MPWGVPVRATNVDIVVVGAGFAGLYALYRLRELDFRVRVVEASGGVGGTWYWNRYPGARCDVESLEYSFSFSRALEQTWQWTERYAAQPEILAYANHIADRFDLRRDIDFDTRVRTAILDETRCLWRLDTDNARQYLAGMCIMAIGCLSVPRRPDFKGLDDFEGKWYHTGFWPHHAVDFRSKRVGVVGTGSSAIQAIPIIARQAEHLTVFQRTANFSIPARNRPMDEETASYWKANYPELRFEARRTSSGILNMDNDDAASDLTPGERQQEIEGRWTRGGLSMWNAFSDILTDEGSNAQVADFVREKIRETVRKSDVAEMLCPKDYPLGTKRLCVDTRYYDTFNRDNVSLVDLRRSPIETLTKHGLRTRDRHYALDVLVFATGFDAMSGPLLNIDLRGRAGATIADWWRVGPRTYLGLAIAGFPNLFLVAGPGSPSVLCNMILAIEQHVDWIADCLSYLRRQGFTCIEASAEAERDWVEHCNETAEKTLYPKANSWYMGANIPGKARVFMPYVGGAWNYRQKCDAVATNRYEGFLMA